MDKLFSLDLENFLSLSQILFYEFLQCQESGQAESVAKVFIKHVRKKFVQAICSIMAPSHANGLFGLTGRLAEMLQRLHHRGCVAT
jgi:hypothetical protein